MDNTIFILILLVVPVGGFFIWRSRKKKKEQGGAPIAGKKRKTENESWNTIKTYLKNQNETGKEIVELFVCKRPDAKETSHLNKDQKKEHALEQKKQKTLDKLEKQKDPKAFKAKKAHDKKAKMPELWMLYFTTRNAKTNVMDEPRILEAIITHQKISKKKTDRVITVNDKINFEDELKWILPLKQKEDEQQLKNQKMIDKKKQKDLEKKQKKNAKVKSGNKVDTSNKEKSVEQKNKKKK